jgi:hypothetical protein
MFITARAAGWRWCRERITSLATTAASPTLAMSRPPATNGPVLLAAAQLFMDLTYASDHLPVVADYTIPLPAPRINSFSFSGNNLTLSVTNAVTNAVYTVLMTTNLTTVLTNWTSVATNTASGGNFTFTSTNSVNPAAVQRFYLLKGK